MTRDEPKSGFNLSRWALEHPALTRYLMVVLLLGGVFAFSALGQDEDPPFTFRAMVVRAFWPGATAQEVERELTERIEKKLQEAAWVDVVRSASKPGESLVFVILKDYTPKAEVPEAWRQVRKKLRRDHGFALVWSMPDARAAFIAPSRAAAFAGSSSQTMRPIATEVSTT